MGAGLVATAYVLGLRHGIDWDHIAAIADITSSQGRGRSSITLATLYALGHALVVLVLGGVAIAAGGLLPRRFDAVMEVIVGTTLIALGVYVFYSLLRYGPAFRMRSRWMLVVSGVRRAVAWLRRRRSAPPRYIEIVHDHEHRADEPHGHRHKAAVRTASGSGVALEPPTHRHRHRHVAPLPEDPFTTYDKPTAFVVGLLHGIGAETPTQVLVLIAAAGATGNRAGVMLLGAFVFGLLCSNTVVAVLSAFGFSRATYSERLYGVVAAAAGGFSVIVGILLASGRGHLLPALFG